MRDELQEMMELKDRKNFRKMSLNLNCNFYLHIQVTIDPELTGMTREDLRLVFEENNIESRPLWKPMHLQPLFQDCPYYGRAVAEGLFENGLCLPSGSNLSATDRDRITAVLDAFFSSRA